MPINIQPIETDGAHWVDIDMDGRVERRVHFATPTKPKPWPGRSPESVARCFTAERISIAHVAACRQTGRRPGGQAARLRGDSYPWPILLT